MGKTHLTSQNRTTERPPDASEAGEPAANAPQAPAVEQTREEQASQVRGVGRLWNWSARVLPPVVVFGLLAAVGYWGHHNEWKMPAFSELTGNEKVAGEPWCDAHGVPEAICISCNAHLMPKGELYGWCQEHGIAECILEHPDRAQLRETPTVSEEDLRRARVALALKDRPANDPLCKMHLRRIQFASREAADNAGIDIGLVGRGRVVETIEAVGEIHYDPTLVTRLASRASGTVWRVDKNVGDAVREGELLALVDAVAVGQSKAELQQAVALLHLHNKR